MLRKFYLVIQSVKFHVTLQDQFFSSYGQFVSVTKCIGHVLYAHFLFGRFLMKLFLVYPRFHSIDVNIKFKWVVGEHLTPFKSGIKLK